jgi:site-specific DNA recombinase
LESLPAGHPSCRSTDDRDVLLTAIAKAHFWIGDLVEGRVISFAEIAKREGKVERHIRLLAPLAFVSPRTVADIVEGTSRAITVTDLAKKTAYSWSGQLTVRHRHV